MNDMDLVREYVVGKSDQAFASIVSRHINLVYSAALRQSGDALEAEEVTQAVFLILARKAASLNPDTILSGWLYQTARFAAANARRAAIRQHRRDEEAQMQFMQNSQTDDSWRRLAPVLEEAMSNLGRKERDAMILRYFENRTIGEVAAALRLNEAAAQKRVNRGTEKLRKFFVKRGVPVSVAVLGASLCANAVQAAPGALLSVVAAKSAAAGGSTLALANATLKLMTWTKLKTAAWVATATLGATATATIAIEAVAVPQSRVQFEGEGFLLRENFAPDGAVGRTWTNYFKVTVRDGEWRIVTQRANERPDFTEVSYDGNELVRIIHYENFQKEQLSQGGIPGKTAGLNSAQADVQYFPVPRVAGGDGGCLAVWFAYASQSYLDHARAGYLAPLADFTGEDAMVRNGYEQKAQLTRRAAPPGLPERGVFFDDGRYRNSLGTFERPSPFNQGFTNSVFQALAFTNLAGMDIPTHFTLSNFQEKPGGTSANDVFCNYEWDGYLTNLSKRVSVTDFKPKFPKGIVYVQDFRFSGGEPYINIVEFNRTNSGWLTTTQVKRLPAFQKVLSEVGQMGPLNARDDGLLDSEGKRVDLQPGGSFHPLNFPNSLRRHHYPNPIFLAFQFAGVALLCAFLLRMAVRRASRQPKYRAV